ncbi:TAP-like protein [Hirsutella rhossiliensis]|uniref:TAP-like protein n=1 Tax=Hirsutella rhossiliensis TaxID=111463 RepID=A0A9P8SL45_9HYPO|nr:TAP-like protein [Hirsutella rhossiliensis]KAH0964761.1 TAP-like protein [Hirsutella rhossiliensis]
MLNFGGPGLTARETLANLASLLQALCGGRYNLIAFDPRGTGNTVPFTCYDRAYWMQTFFEDPIAPNDPDEIPLGKLWSRGSIVSNLCAKKHSETGRMIGTTFVARDIVRVAEALGEDGLVRYWGFSYGSTLGATLISMFPDKVDKVILDGVQNPHEYYNAFADYEEWAQSDQVFSGIFQACAANPDQCSLARPGKSAADLESSVWDLFETLKRRPIPVGTLTLDNNVLRRLVSGALYTTTAWKNLTDVFDMLVSGNISEQRVLDSMGGAPSISDNDLDSNINQSAASIMPFFGIHCSDRAARAQTFDNVLPSIHRLFQISKIMGGVVSLPTITCSQWKLEPKERYRGDFHVRPRRPVLLVGNTYDGQTPLASARNVSSGFKDSVVLEVNGYGHTSLNLPSMCALKTVSSYWLNGTLPQPGTVCEVDAPPFSNITWNDLLKNSSKEEKRHLKRNADHMYPVAFNP